jgi:hypothetical protein
MAAAFKGASTEAANLDPYQRMQIIFGEIQEKLGTALLPVLDKFAAWMMSPPGQKALQGIADAAHDVLTELTNTANWAIKNKDWLLPLLGGVAAIGTAAKTIAGITVAIKAATAAMALFNTTTLLNPLVLAGATGLAILSIPGSAPVESPRPRQYQFQNAPAIKPIPSTPKSGFDFGSGRVVQNNITINTPKVNGQDIINTVNNATRNGFTGTLRALKE